MILSNDDLVCCFVNSSQEPIREEHVCFYVQPAVMHKEKYLQLIEVIKKFYPHPEAPTDMMVELLTTRVVKTIKKDTSEAASLILLQAAQDNSKNYWKIPA